MRCLTALLLAAFLTQAAKAQQNFGDCTLRQLVDQIGNCTQCPSGGQSENCTNEEITYDAYCAGMCLFGKECEPSDTEIFAVYKLNLCISDCADPYFPECSRDPYPAQIIYDTVPTACGCTTIG